MRGSTNNRKTSEQESLFEQADLTGTEKQTLRTAAKKGYFKTPREATLNDIAAEREMSSREVSEQLRAAIDKILTNQPIEIAET